MDSRFYQNSSSAGPSSGGPSSGGMGVPAPQQVPVYAGGTQYNSYSSAGPSSGGPSFFTPIPQRPGYQPIVTNNNNNLDDCCRTCVIL